MKLESRTVVYFVLAVSLMGLGACRGKSDSAQGSAGIGDRSGGVGKAGKSLSSKDGNTERDLNQEEIQKQIQEQTERSIQMANQQRQMMMQQMQTQRAQEQAVQNALQAQRQAQQATNAANQARQSGQKR